MDPDAALETLRELVTEINENREQAIADPDWILTEFAESFEAIDNWLVSGGFLPADWKKGVRSEPIKRSTDHGNPEQVIKANRPSD
jgi:hypothetical protein